MLNQPLTTGSMVSMWHANRGHVYVVAGLNRATNTVDLIRHNCFNADGSIHKATITAARSRVANGIDPFAPVARGGLSSCRRVCIQEFIDIDGVKTAPMINRVYGDKELTRDRKRALADFIRGTLGSRTLIRLKPEHEVYPPLEVTADHRAPAQYF